MKRIIIKTQDNIDELEIKLSKTLNNNDSSKDDLSEQIYNILLIQSKITAFNILRLDININPFSIALLWTKFTINYFELPRADIANLEAICFYLKIPYPGTDPLLTCAPSEVKELKKMKKEIAK